MNTSWKAGVAKTVITPTEPMWLAGWAVRTEAARETFTDLFAKALAIENADGSRFVLVTADLIAIPRDIADAVAAQIRQEWKLPREWLMFCASHTHGGPEVRPDKVPFFHIPREYAAKIEPYMAWLVGRLVDLVGAALADLEGTRLFVARTTFPIAHNRRGAGVVDHDVPVLKANREDNSYRAIVFGYACHNLVMPPEDYRYCGDYAGVAQHCFDARNNTTSLFLAGAGADQNPEPRGSIAMTRKYGEKLAEAVLFCPDPWLEIAPPLRVAYADVLLDFQPLPTGDALEADRTSDDLPRRTKAEYLVARLERGEPFPEIHPCPIQAVRFGDQLLLIAIGGEPVVDYAHELKRRYGGGNRVVWVAGYANDMFGYVPSAAVLREGGYEGTRSLLWSALPAPFAENTERRLLDGIDRLVQQVGWTHGDR
jgi:hypothetical protein